MEQPKFEGIAAVDENRLNGIQETAGDTARPETASGSKKHSNESTKQEFGPETISSREVAKLLGNLYRDAYVASEDFRFIIEMDGKCKTVLSEKEKNILVNINNKIQDIQAKINGFNTTKRLDLWA